MLQIFRRLSLCRREGAACMQRFRLLGGIIKAKQYEAQKVF